MRLRQAPARVATGAYILHSGLEKWNGGEELAEGVHGMASGAYPFLKPIPPAAFLRLVSVTEIATGTALLAPFVPASLAGALLTGFSGSLVGMYLRTPALRRENSVWPSPAGVGIAKDVWLVGVGLSLIADDAACSR